MPETATEAPAVAPLVAGTREVVIGARMTVVWLTSFLVATVVGTIAVMTFIDSRMEGKVMGVRADMDRFRMDMKEGLGELKEEMRLLRYSQSQK